MKKTFGIILLSCLLATTAMAQEDSSFHNYLYDSRTAYFNQLPIQHGAVIFFGDSITQWGDWAEILGFKKVLNRGIIGDNSYGLFNRIDEIVRHQPKKIFILVGTNDINKKSTLASITQTYSRIIDAIKKQSQSTEIYVQSVFPINNELINRQYYIGTNEQIAALNLELKKMCGRLQVTYVNVYDTLLDRKQQLAAIYTYDGLHLSGKGYLAWIKVLSDKKLL